MHLLFGGRPPYIPRLVISIVIRVSVQTVLFAGTPSHISKEVREIVPAVTNLNSPGTVKIVILIARIVTAIHHAGPKAVERVWMFAGCKTMSCAPRDSILVF